jgi:predicted SAM-dependent methyltransferase
MISPVTWLKARRLPRRGLKLHLGCGTVYLDGWVNVDLDAPAADLQLDITRGVPLGAGSTRLIYHEHVMEHITADQGAFCLKDWHRLLEPGGVVRIATPDLAYVVDKYKSADWREQAWLRLPEYAFIKTPAEMLNVSMRWWDHQYLYDGQELERRMREAGFQTVRRCRYRESPALELAGLETREDSTLILEGVR